MWNVIGGRLGFVQFPGSETEPAKCGPGAAQALQNIYKTYLQFFDNWYATQIMEKRIQAQNQAQNQLQNQLAATQQVQARPAAQMQQLIQMSNLSVADLVARGVDEKTIQFVEAHRANLQRSFTEQKVFQAKMRPALNGAPGGPPGPNGVPSGPRPPGLNQPNPFGVGVGPAPQDPTALAAVRQQFMQQQHQQQQQLQQQQQQQQQVVAQQQLQQQGQQGPMQPGQPQHMQQQQAGQQIMGGPVMNMGPRSMSEMTGQPHNMMGGRPSQPIMSAEQFIRKVKAEFMQRGALGWFFMTG